MSEPVSSNSGYSNNMVDFVEKCIVFVRVIDWYVRVWPSSLPSVAGPQLGAGPGSVGGCPSAFFSTISPVAAKGVRGAHVVSGVGSVGAGDDEGDGDDGDDDEFEAALASAIGKAVTRDARNVFGGHAVAADDV